MIYKNLNRTSKKILQLLSIKKITKIVKPFLRKLVLFGFVLMIIYGIFAVDIYVYSLQYENPYADAAIVLGTAVWGKEPSPVFQERINHAIELFNDGKVRFIIFTGAKGEINEPSESQSAKDFAISKGIPEEVILIEEESRTTYENLYFAGELGKKYNLDTYLIVSDPLHMKRAMKHAKNLGMNVSNTPTPTTKYISIKTKLKFLFRETYLYIQTFFRNES